MRCPSPQVLSQWFHACHPCHWRSPTFKKQGQRCLNRSRRTACNPNLLTRALNDVALLNHLPESDVAARASVEAAFLVALLLNASPVPPSLAATAALVAIGPLPPPKQWRRGKVQVWRVKTIRTVLLLSPPPLALPLVLATIAHFVVAALLPVNLVVLVVADKSVSRGPQLHIQNLFQISHSLSVTHVGVFLVIHSPVSSHGRSSSILSI